MSSIAYDVSPLGDAQRFQTTIHLNVAYVCFMLDGCDGCFACMQMGCIGAGPESHANLSSGS